MSTTTIVVNLTLQGATEPTNFTELITGTVAKAHLFYVNVFKFFIQTLIKRKL